MQRMADDFSEFQWFRGAPKKWRRTGEDFAFRGSTAELVQETYQPLATSPEPCESFVALGRLAIREGRRLEKTAPRITRRIDDEPAVVDVDRQTLVLFALRDGDVLDDALRFLRQWGSPMLAMPGDELIVSGRWLLEAATELYEANLLVKEVNEGNVDAGETLRGMFARRLVDHVKTDGYSFWCDSLLAAMWLQLSELRRKGGSWHFCDGCGRLFLPTHARQRYHDDRCRYRAQHQRRKEAPNE